MLLSVIATLGRVQHLLSPQSPLSPRRQSPVSRLSQLFSAGQADRPGYDPEHQQQEITETIHSQKEKESEQRERLFFVLRGEKWERSRWPKLVLYITCDYY